MATEQTIHFYGGPLHEEEYQSTDAVKVLQFDADFKPVALEPIAQDGNLHTHAHRHLYHRVTGTNQFNYKGWK